MGLVLGVLDSVLRQVCPSVRTSDVANHHLTKEIQQMMVPCILQGLASGFFKMGASEECNAAKGTWTVGKQRPNFYTWSSAGVMKCTHVGML